jgi:GNAT superfamily N-acetyltransferase
MTQSHIHSRPVTEADFWRVREFLTATERIAPLGHVWDVRWWDSQHFYNPSGRWENGWERGVRVWETAEGALVACANWEDAGDAYLQVHPAYRFLEPEMLEWAEEALAAPVGDGGGRALTLWVFEYDTRRQRVLRERGYEPTEEWGVVRHMTLPDVAYAPALPRPGLPAPYVLREVRPEDDGAGSADSAGAAGGDCQRIADLLNAAFGRTFHNAAEYKMYATLAPSYVNELDLVAVAPDGSFAAYVAMPYNRENRRGIFEPVCTHPEHLRKGLASALMFEALARVRELGAVDVVVGTGDMAAANALYDSIGFTEAYRQVGWRKRW